MTTNPLLRLFRKSPFQPLQKHMRIVLECAQDVRPLIEALLVCDGPKLDSLRERINGLEGEADDLKNEIRSRLPKSLFMPVDRADLLHVLRAQDSIANIAQDIGVLLSIRRLEAPEPLKEPLKAYVQTVLGAVDQSARIVAQLDELLELGFRGREAERVEAMVEELAATEHESDLEGIEVTRLLVGHDGGMSPAEFTIWYEVVRKLGALADSAEDIGERIRLLLAR